MFSNRRLRLFLTLSISALILAFWGFQGDDYTQELTERDSYNDIDGFLVNSETLQFDLNGDPKHLLIADRTDHYPEQQRSKLQQPDLRLYRHDKPDVVAVSERGEVGPNSEEILMINKVRITEQIDNGYRMLTDFLRIEPDNDYAETHAPVTLLQAHSRTDAIGMELYLDQERLRLLQDVRGHHEPR